MEVTWNESLAKCGPTLSLTLQKTKATVIGVNVVFIVMPFHHHAQMLQPTVKHLEKINHARF